MKEKLKALGQKAWGKAKALFLKPPAVPEPDPKPVDRAEPEYDWQYLVTPGHVIFARLNHLAFIGKRLFAVAIVAGLLLAFGTSYSAKLTVEALQSGYLHRTLYLNAAAEQNAMTPEELALASTDFAVDLVQLQRKATGFNINKIADQFNKVDKLHGYIIGELASLNRDGKPSMPCYISNGIAQPWTRHGQAYYAFCNSVGGSDGTPRHIWLYALISDGKGTLKPWLGVFVDQRKWLGLKANWVYKSIVDDRGVLMRHPEADGVEEINVDWLKNTLARDFPDLPVMQAQVSNSNKGRY